MAETSPEVDASISVVPGGEVEGSRADIRTDADGEVLRPEPEPEPEIEPVFGKGDLVRGTDGAEGEVVRPWPNGTYGVWLIQGHRVKNYHGSELTLIQRAKG
jgi:hypothetical protein